MRLAWTEEAWEDYVHWQSADRKVLQRINQLLDDIRRHPFHGIGKPEPLKGPLKSWWSRRITQEHRLVYSVKGERGEQMLVVAQCRYHY